MRALVVSDIHGNAAALRAVLGVPHDLVLCLGDIVGYGPYPGACVEIIREQATLCVQGNHDRAFGAGVPPGASARFQGLAAATTPIANAQLSDEDRRYLRELPRWGFIRLAGRQFMAVHATPRDPLYEYLGPDRDAWIERARTMSTDVLLVGHTHLQFRIDAGDRVIVNPGSLGQPKDGDPRAAYAVIDDGNVTLHRIAYDVEATVQALLASPVPAAAGTALAALLRTGRVAAMDAHVDTAPVPAVGAP
ncbi:MAG: metallophosphoesterase family protein [Gemmatimonadota bacterium]|nr:metallophosphoesterase family protein [Gemmatimonadota bacterium]